jgi:hypothetical protein
MAFKNRIRLPIQLFRPQFLEEREVYRKSSGEVNIVNSLVRKVYQGETDLLPESVHERIKIALSHDVVSIESPTILANIVQDGEYNITWPDFLDYAQGKAVFNAEVKNFNATNSNCAACDDLLGLELQDDRYENAYGILIPLAEGGTFTIDVTQNDVIACSPATFSIATFNSNFIASISINASGVVTFTLKTNLPDVSEAEVFTYRVTCPNGNYDEASCVIAIDGSISVCNPPTNIVALTIAPTEYLFKFTAPFTGAPAGGYEYRLYEASDPLTVIDSGPTTGPSGLNINLIGLNSNTQYILQVRSICGAGDYSTWVTADFSTPPETESCGTYDVNWSDGSGLPNRFTIVTYMACDGTEKTIAVYNDVGRPICALQNSPGDPVYIDGATEIIYVGLC